MSAEPSPQNEALTFPRFIAILGVAASLLVVYLLREVLTPLFLAFLLAYALDPLVERLERVRVPRPLAAVVVMLGILALLAGLFVFAIPMFLDELRDLGAALPTQIESLGRRVEPSLWATFHLQVPHSLAELSKTYGDRLQAQMPGLLGTVAVALFGTLSYVSVLFSALIVPVFALYLLIDFDRIVVRTRELVPRRWARSASQLASQIHYTLGSYVRGQITTNIVLAALYASVLRLVDVRLAVPIGVLTGMLAFVPYIGFAVGLLLALTMATLDWHGLTPLLEVVAVMGLVQVVDGLVVTPRIVGRSVDLAPLEVLLAMSAAASLLGFLGVLLAVPLGAIMKIILRRAARAYLESEYYRQPPAPRPGSASRSRSGLTGGLSGSAAAGSLAGARAGSGSLSGSLSGATAGRGSGSFAGADQAARPPSSKPPTSRS